MPALTQSSLGAPAALAAAQQPADAQEDLLASLLESQQMGPALKAIFDRSWQGARWLLLMLSVSHADVCVA